MSHKRRIVPYLDDLQAKVTRCASYSPRAGRVVGVDAVRVG